MLIFIKSPRKTNPLPYNVIMIVQHIVFSPFYERIFSCLQLGQNMCYKIYIFSELKQFFFSVAYKFSRTIVFKHLI